MKKGVAFVTLLILLIASLTACRWRCKLYDSDYNYYIGTEYYTALTADHAKELCQKTYDFDVDCTCWKD